MKSIFLMTLLYVGCLGTPAHAHDQRSHGGKPVEGEVVSVADDKLTLRTSEGLRPITLDAKTRFERGSGPASKEDIKPGDHVSIRGTKLEDGLVAREVVIQRDDTPADGHGRHESGGQAPAAPGSP